jgi:predicted amidohydrolase YtcJ
LPIKNFIIETSLPRECAVDLILLNGKVITVDSENSIVEAVAIKDGKIVRVGNNKEVKKLAGQKTLIIDLRGKAVLPGFIDTHLHPGLFGINLMEVDCRSPPVKSIADILERIKKRANKLPGGTWVRGWGYDDTKLIEKRHPTRWDLDKATTDHPVYLRRICGHVGVANSKALELAGISKHTPDPPGGKIERDPKTGEPTGVLRETAQILDIIPPYSEEEIKEALRLACEKFTQWGLTTVGDAAGSFADKYTPLYIRAYQDLLAEGKLPLRVRIMLSGTVPSMLDAVQKIGLKTGWGNDMLKVTGGKLIVDGGIGARTAYVYESYINDPENFGILRINPDELKEKIIKMHEAGLRPCVHAIGDKAIDLVLDAFEEALKKKPNPDHRMRIEHCSLCTPKQLRRIAKLGIIAASSITFIYHLGDSFKSNLGKERMKWCYPLKAQKDYGIVTCANSDCPVCSANPMLGIYSAVTRKTLNRDVLDNSECISVMEAIRMYTINAAYAFFDEEIIGSIEPGKLADLVVLSEDILTIPPEEIKNVEVIMTIINGKIVYQKDNKRYKRKYKREKYVSGS